MNKNFILSIIFITLLCDYYTSAQEVISQQIDKKVTDLMKKGNIPGISLTYILEGVEYKKVYGHSNLKTKINVTPKTLFELGDVGMTFTGLGFLEFAKHNNVKLDQSVSDYLPWFSLTYNHSDTSITLRQLLHHTSGIPSSALFQMAAQKMPNTSISVANNIQKIELVAKPGDQFIYSRMNYLILAWIIEKVTRRPFREYMKTFLSKKLALKNTSVSFPISKEQMARGHKISFFKARMSGSNTIDKSFVTEQYRSNIEDMGVWLRWQLGLENSELKPLVLATHQRDETVGVHNMQSYGMGWHISLDGSRKIWQSGQTPGFASFISLRPDIKTGAVVLANANSPFVTHIGQQVMQILTEQHLLSDSSVSNSNDRLFSFFAIIAIIYLIFVLVYLVWIVIGLRKGERSLVVHKNVVLKKIVAFVLGILPFLIGLYFVPNFVGYYSWDNLLSWNTSSIKLLGYVAFAGLILNFAGYILAAVFPSKEAYFGKIPLIIFMSVISGLSDVAIIYMITSSFQSNSAPEYRMFYFLLVVFTYLMGRRIVQYNLIRISFGLVYDLKKNLINKIFSTSYKSFEVMDKGRVYSVLNEDVNTIGRASNTLASLVISGIAIIGCFVYLGTISLKITLALIGTMFAVALIYNFVVQSTEVLYEKARDEGNTFMRLMDGMLNGFKELSLHKKGKLSYRNDLTDSAFSHKEKVITADTRFLNADLLGESMLLILLGVITIGLPLINPKIDFYILASFIIVMLYVIAPIQGLLSAAPQLMRIKVAWKRINKFIEDIPIEVDLEGHQNIGSYVVKSLELEGITFQYSNAENGHGGFGIGPIDLTINKGEIIFIIGANGSGKSTLAKILIGLYTPKTGKIRINGTSVNHENLREHFSAVFNPTYIFEKLYNVDSKNYNDQDVGVLLETLKLSEKVKVENNRFSTIDLSSGQRKRLALLQCYLEDYPIFLFDEWAADQDPYYRNFFYNTLLPRMKQNGKIVIAITHDDSYFELADRVYEMRDGRLNKFDTTRSLVKIS